jgi:hypothetical protein
MSPAIWARSKIHPKLSHMRKGHAITAAAIREIRKPREKAFEDLN